MGSFEFDASYPFQWSSVAYTETPDAWIDDIGSILVFFCCWDLGI